jgi:hypothetical protein
MEPTAAEVLNKRLVDVTGLPEEAIRAVESVVAVLRGQGKGRGPQLVSYDEWSKAFREWLAGHQPRGTSADWSRDGIYAGRGE